MLKIRKHTSSFGNAVMKHFYFPLTVNRFFPLQNKMKENQKLPVKLSQSCNAFQDQGYGAKKKKKER